MTALGFYDSMNFLGLGAYLFAGLLGLIAAQFLLLSLGTEDEKKKGVQWLNILGVILFSLYTAYDIQVLRVKASECKAQRNQNIHPDYPADSLGIYLDILNLFSDIGDLADS